MTETLEQQSAILAKQQEDLAAQKVAYEQSQQKLSQIESQYMPKVGGVNIAYEHKYKAQLGQTQEQYKQLSSGIEQYNVGIESFKGKSEIAQVEIAKLNTTPTSLSDISFAKELYEKGYISKSDLDSYKDIAFKNIKGQEQQKVVTKEIVISDPIRYNKSLGATSADLAKIEMLQSPTAQWTSQESYNAALKSITDKGFYVGKPGGTILSSTPEQRQAEKMVFEKTGFTLLPESFKSDVFLSELQKLSPEQKESLSFAVSFPEVQTERIQTYTDPITGKSEKYYPHFTPYVTEEGIQKSQEIKQQIKSEKWWSGLSEFEKKMTLGTASVIDIGIAGGYLGEKIFGTEESDWKTGIYKQFDTKSKPFSLERIQEGVSKVGTGTTAQAVAMMVGMGAAMKIGAGTLKAVGMTEAGVVAGEKLVGLGFGGVIVKELGTTAFVHGKPGTALAELGLLAAVLPAAGIGTRIVSGIGKYTPKPTEFYKFVAEKSTPIKTTETFKFVEAKAEPITSKIPEARVVRAFEGTRGLAEGGIIDAVALPSTIVREGLPSPKRFVEFTAKKAEPLLYKTVEVSPFELKPTMVLEPIIGKKVTYYDIIEPSGKHIGTTLVEVSAKKAHIGTLELESAMRGKGTGTKVAKQIISDLQKRGVTEIKLETKGDPKVISFWKKQGFEFTPGQKVKSEMKLELKEPITTKELRQPIRFISEKTPDFIKSLRDPVVAKATREPLTSELMPVMTRKIYEKLPTSQAKTYVESGLKAYELLKNMPEKLVKEMFEPYDYAKIRKGSEITPEVNEIMLKYKGIEAGSAGTKPFIRGYREVRTPSPEGKEIPTGIGDRDVYLPTKGAHELLAKVQKKYPESYLDKEPRPGVVAKIRTKDGRELIDIHHISDWVVGEPITTKFMGEHGVILGKAKVMKPIEVGGRYYENPIQQVMEKITGSIKYMSRKIPDIGTKEAREKEFGEGGFSIRRDKDVQDPVELIKEIGAKWSKTDPKEGQKVIELAEKMKIAEAADPITGIKMYATTPEAMALQYGYEFGKAYYEMQKGKPLIPLFLSTKPEEKIKIEKEEYYPKEKKEDRIGYYPILPTKEIFGGYYPSPIVKKETPVGYYPLFGKIEHPSGYYVPGKDDYYPPKPPVEKKKVPPILPPTKKEYPEEFLEPSKKMRDEVRKGKPKEKIGYKYKYRPSPIFEGAEKLFEDKTDMVRLEAPRKPQIKRRLVKTTKPKKEEFNLGLEGMDNPLTERVKYKKKNIVSKNKTPSWL